MLPEHSTEQCQMFSPLPSQGDIVSLQPAVKVVILASPSPEAVAEASDVEECLW